jgi:hypothetical protein
MITIKEIRDKYPDYHDLSDEQLADSLHDKHYSDIPKEEFYSKIGFKPQSSLSKGIQFLKEDASNLAKNLGVGTLNMGRNLANTPHRLASLVGLGDTPGFGNLAPEEFDYAKTLGLDNQNQNSIVQSIPEITASFAIPGSTIPRMIAGQAAFGATQNKNPLIGAAEGGAGALVGAGVGKLIETGFNKLKPSSLLRGNLSKEQLAKNLKTTKGTETSLGQVIENPILQRLSENVLPNVIGSGAEKTMQRTANQVVSKGEELLHGLREGELVHENYGSKIKEALQESAKSVETEKTSKFRKVNEMAGEHGVTTERSNLRKTADDALSQINSDPDLAQFIDKADSKLLKNLSQHKENPWGSANTYSLKDTDILRGKIGEKAHEANIKGEKPRAAIYQRLKKALEEDVNNAIERSKSPELKTAHKEAMDYYKNEYVPYQDIQKFVKKGGDPDLILSHFLKMGSNDRVQLLRKLGQSQAGEKNLIGNAYLSPAYEEGKLNPLKLSTLYHKLGKRQRVELFGAENNKKIKTYTDLVRKNKEGFNLMFNPKTGARLGHIGTVAGVVGSGGLHLPSILGMGALGNVANRLLTSESFREKLISAMIKDKKLTIPKAIKVLSAGGGLAARNE